MGASSDFSEIRPYYSHMQYPNRRQYKEAKRRVKQKKNFYKTILTFVGISIFLTAINLITSPGYFWAIFPILGMGLGAFIQAVKIYGPYGTHSDWERKELEKEMRRLKDTQLDQGLDLPDPRQKLELKDLEKRQIEKEKLKKWDDEELV